MPAAFEEDLTSISISVTEEQNRQLRKIQLERSTPYAKASLASVAREVIAIGLEAISAGQASISETSLSGERSAA